MTSKVAPEVINEDLEVSIESSEGDDETNGHLRRLERDKKIRSKCLVKISDPWRVKWDIFVIFLALYNCFAIPFEVAFQPKSDSEVTVAIFDILIDMIFILDIVIVFRTAYINVDTGEMIEDARKIAKDYMKKVGFYIDVCASIPLGFFTLFVEVGGSSIQLVKLLKLIRILRLSKIILSMRIKDKAKIMLRICKLILYIIIYLHFIACLWFIVVDSERAWVPNTDGILADKFGFYSESISHRYIYCMYIAVNSLVGIEIMPQTTGEVVFCLVTVFMGALFVSYILGEIADSVSNLNKQMNDFYENVGTATTTMNNLKINNDVQLEVNEYMTATFQYTINLEEWNQFIEIVPPSYIREINSQLYKNLIINQNILQEFDGIFEFMVKRLEFTFINPDEYLTQIGDESDKFYLVVDGALEVVVYDFKQEERKVKLLRKGDICGEIGLLFNIKRTASLLANSYSKVGMLDHSDFTLMINQYSDLQDRLLEQILNYNDPYRKGVKRILRRLPYMRKISPYTLDKVIASLETYRFQPGTVVIESGSQPQHLFLLIEGEIVVSCQVNDKTTSKSYRTRFSDLTRQEGGAVFVKRAKTKKNYSDFASKHTKYMTWIDFDALDEGAILCGTQCVLKNKVKIKCQTANFSTFLLLKQEVLEHLSLIDHELKVGLNQVRMKYSHYNDYMDENIVIPPILDYFKVHRNVHSEEKRKLRLKHRLRDAIMMCVLRCRKKIKSNTTDFGSLVKKVTAITKAEGKSWTDVVKLIEKEVLDPEALDAADMLKEDEVTIPILTQFAGIANRFEGQIDSLNYQFSLISEEVNGLIDAREKVKGKIMEIMDILR